GVCQRKHLIPREVNLFQKSHLPLIFKNIITFSRKKKNESNIIILIKNNPNKHHIQRTLLNSIVLF
ncbi:hypothetical protein ACJBQ6_10775, partial [Streptococcus suis]